MLNRRYRALGGVGVLLLLFGASAWKKNARAEAVARANALTVTLPNEMRLSVDSLDAALAEFSAIIGGARASTDTAQISTRAHESFAHSRAQYKRMEALAEFYVPAIAAALNSRRQEVDDDDAPPPSSMGPRGFPALETFLWTEQRDSISVRTVVDSMRKAVERICNASNALVPTNAQFFELARLEITRIGTLGIAGFDTPISKDAINESATALDGVRALFAKVAPNHWPELGPEEKTFDFAALKAIEYLRKHSKFEDFDHLQFITGYFNPMARSLEVFRRSANVVPVAIRRGWRADVGSVYDADAFDAAAYAADDAPRSTQQLVALGKRLFSDPSLSGTGTRSCSTCHIPSHAFTDGLSLAARIDAHGVIARHTPTLLNAALSPAQFADERAITLEEQVLRVVQNSTEMGGNLEVAANTISKRADYAGALNAAFGKPAITPSQLRFALAAYVRSLVALNSRFDRAARGDTAQLTSQERRGFSMFMGKAGCGTCHFAPLFNGNTPPLYLSADVEVIGTPFSPLHAAQTDSDSGRSSVDHLPLHYRAFKTPTVRNAALSAPFMHNGAFRSLDEVIRFYDGGGGAGAGARIDNQTLSAGKLKLSDDERAAIIAFIGSLTDTVPAYRH